jgi:hypothetical protein
MVAIAPRGPRGCTAASDFAPQGNYYALFQVKPYADIATIRGAYRRLARSAHPDVNSAPQATAQMRAVNEAYAVLRDPPRRAAYDVTRFRWALEEAHRGMPTVAPALPVRSRSRCMVRALAAMVSGMAASLA